MAGEGMRLAATSMPLRRALALLVAAAMLLLNFTVASATVGKQALILDSTVTGGASSPEGTRAAALGFTVTVVDDATWGAMTATDFAVYQLIVVGDPTCAPMPEVVGQNAQALADAVMARAGGNSAAGNRVLIGTDPVFHLEQGGNQLVDTAIDFAGAQSGRSGLYLNFSCGDEDYDANGVPDAQDKLLPLLSIDASPTWTQNVTPPCGASASLISNAAQFATLTSGNLQGWFCSVHESFPQFPSDWVPLALATDAPTQPVCGNDVDTGLAACGEPYILIAGSGITATAPNLGLSPLTATNPVGTEHTVTAAVTNPDSTPAGGVPVTFTVTGANAGATGTCAPASCETDSGGHVTFSYTGTNLGDDTIVASITVNGTTQQATAAKTWETATPDPTPTPTPTPNPTPTPTPTPDPTPTPTPDPTPTPTPTPNPTPTPTPTPNPTPTPTPTPVVVGCTPGYWKQIQHFDSWADPYDPTDTFASAGFDDAFSGKSLVDVLNLKGGGLNALGRHTVAALLNSADPTVSAHYQYTTAQIVAAFNLVFPGGDYDALKDLLAAANEMGCPLD